MNPLGAQEVRWATGTAAVMGECGATTTTAPGLPARRAWVKEATLVHGGLLGVSPGRFKYL